eukprot:2099551-Alexandrium_andersonii.AAC.1
MGPHLRRAWLLRRSGRAAPFARLGDFQDLGPGVDGHLLLGLRLRARRPRLPPHGSARPGAELLQ